MKIGMNDYVTKPFEEDKLMGVILKQLRLDPPPIQIQTPATETKIAAGKLYNLDKLVALTRNDNAYVQKMISIFLEQTSQAVEQIQKACAQSDLESLYQVAHKIKPSLGSMGVDVLYQTIRDVEQKANDRDDTPELKRQVDVLVGTLQQLIEQLKLEQI